MIRHKTEASLISPQGDVVESVRIFDPQRSSRRRGISNLRGLLKSVDLTPIAHARFSVFSLRFSIHFLRLDLDGLI